MLDLAEVISELKVVIAQQNKLLEILSKSTFSGCPLSSAQPQQPQPNSPFYGGIKLMNDSAYCGPSTSAEFVSKSPNNYRYQGQNAVQPNIDTLPVWHKPYIPIHCLLNWTDSKGDIPREFKLALVNSTVYKVPPVTPCHYKSMVGEHTDWAARLFSTRMGPGSAGWFILKDSVFDLPVGTLINRNSGLLEGGILYRENGFLYPDPISDKRWF